MTLLGRSGFLSKPCRLGVKYAGFPCRILQPGAAPGNLPAQPRDRSASVVRQWRIRLVEWAPMPRNVSAFSSVFVAQDTPKVQQSIERLGDGPDNRSNSRKSAKTMDTYTPGVAPSRQAHHEPLSVGVIGFPLSGRAFRSSGLQRMGLNAPHAVFWLDLRDKTSGFSSQALRIAQNDSCDHPSRRHWRVLAAASSSFLISARAAGFFTLARVS